MKSMNLNKNRHAELDSASLNKRFRNKFGMAIFILLLFSLSSCSNVFDKKLEEEKSSDKNTYIMIVPDGINIKDRSIEPIIEDALGKMQNINLYATKTADSEGNSVSGSKKRLPNNNISTGSLSTLYNQLLLLEDGAGSYTFDFSCSIDGVYFYQRLENQIIEESKTNLIEFNNLIPMKDSNSSKFTPEYEQFGNFGGIDIKLNFDNPRYMYKKVVVTLNDLSKSPEDEDYVAYSGELDISSKTSVRYQRSLTSASEYISASLGVISTGHIATGEYRITFDFYSKDITTTTKTGTNSVLTKENQKVNSLSYVVRVARGLNSIFEDTIDLNEVYTITYEDCHGSYSCGLSDGQVKVDSYTRKSQDIILPRYYRAYGIFEGWYTQQTGGTLVTTIPSGSSGYIILYAHWRELGESGTPAVLFVDPTSTYPYGIDEDHALPSISEAVKFIGESVGSYHPWTLKIKGPLTENINIADNYGFNTYARSLTLEGIRGLDAYGIPQDEIKGSFTEAVENGATLAVNTKVPVIIKNLKITGGNNSNTGNIKGGGIYVGSYTYSSTTTPASVTLDDGALITGNSAPAGSGVYVSSGATFQMGGGAQVAEGDDVYLPDGTKLLITKMFDGDILHAASITPEIYSEGTQVLDIAPNGSGSLDVEYSVFTVTSQNEGGTTTNWAVDSEGKLTKGVNGGNGNLSINLVTVPGNGSDIPNLLVGKNLITQTEYEHFMKYHGKVVSGSTYEPSETGEAKNTTPAYYVSFVDAVIFCNLLSVENNLEPVYKIGERQNLTGCVSDISEWIKDTSLGISKVGDKYCFAWDRTKPYNDNPYRQWDSIYDGGKLYTDESANGYRLATLNEIVHIANWNISNGFELQSYSGINEWCDAYEQNTCETGIFTANIADSSVEHFENCVTYHKHNAHEAPGYIEIGGEEVSCCGGGENFTRNLGFRVVRNAPENP